MTYMEWLDHEIARKEETLKEEGQKLKLYVDPRRLLEEIASSNIRDILRNIEAEIKTLKDCKDQYIARGALL